MISVVSNGVREIESVSENYCECIVGKVSNG
jgi:hypothetical protein